MSKPHLPFELETAATGFLKEVDDALHEERLLALWHRYKKALVAGVAALVVLVAGREAYQGWQARADAAAAREWYAFSQNGDSGAVPQALLESANPGFRSLALVTEAKQDAAKAVAAYEAVAADDDAPGWLQQISQLNAAVSQLEGDPAAARARLEALAADEAALVRAPAMEVLAALAMGEGDVPAARRLTEQLLVLPNLPTGLRVRAEKRLGALTTLAN
ncbi:MAG: hypothetical protein H6922_00665 [Pseudomonadaceae bacterium]|nr:hypothetical protein [Pseudomonadaceae bacterium]